MLDRVDREREKNTMKERAYKVKRTNIQKQKIEMT